MKHAQRELNSSPKQDHHRIERLIFWTILLSYSNFFSIGEWNQSSRYDAIFATVENYGESLPLFSIDPFLSHPKLNFNTGDWAHHDGHYFSNKAPGTILLGIPIYAAIYFIEKSIFGVDPKGVGLTLFNMWLLNLLLTILPLAFAAVLIFRMSASISLSTQTALLTTFIFAWCTLIWPYSSSLWGHPNAAAALIAAIYFLWRNELVPRHPMTDNRLVPDL